MSEKSLKDQFNDYPDFKKIIVGSLTSTATKSIIDRLEAADVSLEVCDSLIDELEKSVPKDSLKDHLSVITSIGSFILAAFAISQNSSLGTVITSLVTVTCIALFLQYRTIPKRDIQGYLKALRIYKRKLLIKDANQIKKT